MKITKAIEILELNVKVAGKQMPLDVKDALALSIEGLTIIKRLRGDHPVWLPLLLPGETKD